MANEFKIKNGLIVSGSADFEQDLRVRGTLTVDELHTSITTSSIIYESGSTRFGDTIDDVHTFTGSVLVNGKVNASSLTGSINFNNLTNVPTLVSGSSQISYTGITNIPSGIVSGSEQLTGSYDTRYVLSGSITQTTWDNIANKPSGLISGSVQVDLTSTTGYSTFSSSISTSIGSLSSSVATTTSGLSSSIGSLSSSVASIDNTQNGRLDSLETESGSIRTNFNTFTSSYTTVSGSIDNRLDVLEAYSGSQQVPTASFAFRTQRTDVYCKNVSGTQINKGTVVRITGSVGDNPLIGVASLLTEGQSANTLGIAAENIPNDSFGLVITEGVLIGVNTSGMTAGQLIFLGANGTFTTSYPVAPNHGVRLGEVLRVQQNQGSIYVRVDNGAELGESHDVYDTTTNSSYGDLLVKSGSVWVNSRNLNGNYSVTGSLIATSFTGSINYNNLTNVPTLVSGSSQILNGSNVVSSSTQVTNYGFAITGSNLFKGDQTHSGSIIPAIDNAYDLGSPTYQWRDVYISSGSLYIDGTKVISSTTQELQITTDNGQSIKILESGTDSIILQTADGDIELKSNADGDILLDPTNGKIMLKGPVEILNGQKIQSSVGGTPVVFANDIVVSGSIDITGTIEGIDLTAFSSSVNTRLGNLETSGGNLNTFTASANTRLGNLETESGSIRTAVNSYTSSTNNRLTSIETTTGSILSTNTTQDGRLTSIESKTGSYATTGSNVFIGNQTITGSLYVSQDLIIAGSSSIQHISSSVVNIADNIITVNAQNPSIRFGGLAVIDSGSSPQVSGSMLFDSTNDQWIFVHQNQTTVTSSVLLMGPQTFNNLGGEAFPTTNRILKSLNAEHVGDSNISDNGTTVTILSNTIINGTISATGTTLVSGSAQISFNGITDKPALVSGSSQVSFNGITDKPALVSGSAQISFNTITDKPTLVSGSSQVSYPSLSNIPSGIVSGSGQVDLTTTANYSSGIKSRLNAENVLSSSAQVVSALPVGTVSGSSQVLGGTTIHSGSFFNGISVVSGSSQIIFSGITGTPTGLVSGSSQITFGSISSIPSGLVSGSSQVSYPSLSNIPSGIVSGSAQLTSTFVQKAGDTMTGAIVMSGTQQIRLAGFAGIEYYNGTSQWQGYIGTENNTGNLRYNSFNGAHTFYANGTQTMAVNASGQLSLSGSNSGSAPLVNLTATGTGTFQRGVRLLNSGMNSGDHIMMAVGQADSARNMGQFYFQYNGAGSTGNRLSMGLHSVDDVFNIFGSSNVQVGSISDQGYKFHVAGTMNSSGALTQGGNQVLHAGNYTSYSPTLTGGSASGTWGISITGNAATATLASNSSLLNGISVTQIFNNMGDNHSTRTSFDASTPSYNFGFRYVQGSTNGPGTGSGQFYSWYIGLGNDYPATGGGSYGAMFAVDRNVTTPYLSVRYNENNSFGSWRKVAAGYADSAGTVTNGVYTTGSQLNGLFSMSDNAYFTGAPSHGFRWNSSNNAFNNVIMRDNGNMEVRGSLIAGSTGTTPQARIQSVGGMRWSTGGNSYFTDTDMDGGGLYVETVDNNTGRAKMRFQTRVNNSGSYTSYQIDANNSQHFWNINDNRRLTMDSSGHILPGANGTQNIGSASLRWNTVFTSDLSLSNGIGDYTIVEGEEKLYLYNNKNNKVYSFVLQEEDPATATPKKVH